MNTYMYLSNQNWCYSSIMCSHFKILYSVYFVMEKRFVQIQEKWQILKNEYHFFIINCLELILKKLEYIRSLNQNENNFLLSYCTVVYV